MSTSEPVKPVRETALDLIRAAGGGLLIGLPLLYTMEMWDVSFGFSAEPDGEVTVQTIGFRLP